MVSHSRFYSGYQSHAPSNDFFPFSKTKFWWTSIKRFHDNSPVHCVSVSRPCSIVVGSGKITQFNIMTKSFPILLRWRVIMKRQRGLSLNHIAETLFASKTFCEEGGVSIVQKHSWSRKRSDKEKVKETKDIR